MGGKQQNVSFLSQVVANLGIFFFWNPFNNGFSIWGCAGGTSTVGIASQRWLKAAVSKVNTFS